MLILVKESRPFKHHNEKRMKQQAGTDWYRLPVEEVLGTLNSGEQGLSEEEVIRRQEEYGRNVLPEPKPKSLLAIFISQFRDPLIYILIIAGILSLIAGDFKDSIFIFIIIVINAMLGTWQESKAENSAAALKALVRIQARVRRNGNVTMTDATELVPGDIVFLESGMKVPADGRLIDVNDLQVEEALLTGESLAVSKTTDAIDNDISAIGDQVNMVFAATTVMRGRGTAVITGTGFHTEIGKIAASLSESESEKPPLLKRMETFSKKISLAVVVVCFLLGLVGWNRGMPLMDIFFFMVAVGVSAIPEGLPVALTVALAIGTRRMAKRNVIVRKLPAVEGLGSCTLIASDKTGTLTMDQQSVQMLILSNGNRLQVSGKGNSGDGNLEPMNGSVDGVLLEQLITIAVLANEADLKREGDDWKSSGDAVDVAVLSLAFKSGHDLSHYRSKSKVVRSIAYESEKKYSGVFYESDGRLQFGMKGALEVILKHLPEEQRSQAQQFSEELAGLGYRVITIAGNPVEEVWDDELPPLRLIGLVALIDPLRPESIASIEECHQAGISVVMVTGDHPSTALTIARQLKIAEDAEQVMTGRHLLDHAEDPALPSLLKDKKVFARVTPLQKQQIIEALKASGHFVAVTGDGANDAPALKIAHIGIAMGSGTDLAKESASLIVTDNNFASIAAGVEEGRFTYENLRKIIYLLISTGAAEIMLVAIPILIGMPLPFIAVQLLWLNLVTNGIQDISLAFEQGDPEVMRKPPRPPGESIFDKLMVWEIFVSAFIMSAVTILAWWWLTSRPEYNEKHARSLLMMLMVLLQNFHVLNCRSEKRSIFNLPVSHNRFVFLAIITAQLLHISAAFIPGLKDILQLEPVHWKEWILLLPAAFTIFAGMELFKWLIRRSRNF